MAVVAKTPPPTTTSCAGELAVHDAAAPAAVAVAAAVDGPSGQCPDPRGVRRIGRRPRHRLERSWDRGGTHEWSSAESAAESVAGSAVVGERTTMMMVMVPVEDGMGSMPRTSGNGMVLARSGKQRVGRLRGSATDPHRRVPSEKVTSTATQEEAPDRQQY